MYSTGNTIEDDGTYLWIGSDSGLIRKTKIDNSMISYNPANLGMPNNWVKDLAVDSFCFSQKAIDSDTTITKTVKVMESFELAFEDLPGAGHGWYLPVNPAKVIIQLIKKEPKIPNFTMGGAYINTYEYTPMARGTYILEYVFGPAWLKEVQKRCHLKIIVE